MVKLHINYVKDTHKKGTCAMDKMNPPLNYTPKPTMSL